MNGSAISYTTQTIKGIQYAFFPTALGANTYIASYNNPVPRLIKPADTVVVATAPVTTPEALVNVAPAKATMKEGLSVQPSCPTPAAAISTWC